jgi:hypothetical protein
VSETETETETKTKTEGGRDRQRKEGKYAHTRNHILVLIDEQESVLHSRERQTILMNTHPYAHNTHTHTIRTHTHSLSLTYSGSHRRAGERAPLSLTPEEMQTVYQDWQTLVTAFGG